MPFSAIKDLTNGLWESENIDKYDPYLTNRFFSFFPDTLYFASVMNEYSDLPIRVQYSFYLNSIRASKRFVQWPKKNPTEDIDAIRWYFGYSYEKAKQAASILSKDQIAMIKKKKKGDYNGSVGNFSGGSSTFSG